MLKKVIAIYAALAIALSGSVALGVYLLSGVIENNKIQSAMKAENETAAIEKAFHDQAGIYLEPAEPTTEDEITFRVRVARYNVTKAQFQYTTDKGFSWTTVDMEFDRHDDTGYYDYWKVTLPPQSSYIKYRFLLGNNDLNRTVFYTNRTGIALEEPKVDNCWDLLVGFDVPEWAKGTVWYSIIPDVFFNGDTTSDDLTAGGYRDMRQWNIGRGDGSYNLASKYGGDLFGINQKLSYLKELGVESVFANPTSKSGQNVGYGKLAYTDVEDSFGTPNDYKNLLKAVHNKGLHYMQDVDLGYTSANGMISGGGRFFPTDPDYFQDMYTAPKIGAWGGYCLDLGNELSKETVYTTETSILQWLARDIGIDGIRFDTGGWLWGSTETEDLSANDVIRSMKYYIRKINPDFFFLSESSGTGSMIDGAFDSQWNRSLEGFIDNYAMGTVSPSNFANALEYSIDYLPRNIGFTIYNFICQHDTNRAYTDNRFNTFATLLIQFTYVGAPCIFYGEEVYLRPESNGSSSSTWCPPMEWNPAQWDFDMLNYYKALTELRKTYSCLKTGVQNRLEVDDKNGIMAYARWDENGTVITASCLNEEVYEYQINAREAGVKDGAVLTDWLTGKTYEVKDGVAIVSLIPGGSIFVTDGKSSSYRLEYEAIRVGKVNAKTAVYALDGDALELHGDGNLGKGSDDLLFYGVDVYGSFNTSAKASEINGKAAMIVRNDSSDSSAYYAVEIESGNAVVRARNVNGGMAEKLASEKISEGATVRIVRSGSNVFTAYVATADGEWAAIKGSEKKIGMNEGVKVGYAPLSGMIKLTEITREAGAEVMGYDKFDDEEYTGVLNGINNKGVSKADGYLTLEPTGKVDSVYSTSKGQDWTFMAALKYAPTESGNVAGVYCKGSEAEYVAAGRTVQNGKSVMYFGKATDGKLEILYTAEDTKPNDEVVVQLQKIGAVYTAVYSYDAVNWKAIGNTYIVANFSEEKIGPYVLGNQSASFNYVSFGNCINDGKSFNSPSTPHTVNDDFFYNSNADASITQVKVVNLSGTWIPAVGGIEQTDAKVLGAFGAYDHSFYSMRMQATVKFTSGTGWAGFGFGKKSCDSAVNDGFLLKYTTEGVLQLFKGDVKISEVKLAEPQNDEMKLIVETGYKGQIYVYAGDRSQMVMHLENTGYGSGYCTYYTEGVTAIIGNYKIGEMIQNWTLTNGGMTFAEGVIAVTKGSVSTITGVAVTNYVLTLNMVTTVAPNGNNETSLTISAPQGSTGEYDGLKLAIDQHGKVTLSEKGYELKTAQVEGATGKATKINTYVMIVKQNGTYKIYVNNAKTPTIEYTEDYTRGGTLTFSTDAAVAKYDSLKLVNITSKQDYTQVDDYKAWMNGYRPEDLSMRVYKQDFSDSSAISNLIIGGGEWRIENGAIVGGGVGDWAQRVALNALTYGNFIMTVDVKFGPGSGWAGISIRSRSVTGHHADNETISVMVFTGGGVGNVGTDNQKQVEDTVFYNNGQISGFDRNEFNRIKIVAKDSTITVYDGAENKLMTFGDTELIDGYIRLAAGNVPVYFDNVVITPTK